MDSPRFRPRLPTDGAKPTKKNGASFISKSRHNERRIKRKYLVANTIKDDAPTTRSLWHADSPFHACCHPPAIESLTNRPRAQPGGSSGSSLENFTAHFHFLLFFRAYAFCRALTRSGPLPAALPWLRVAVYARPRRSCRNRTAASQRGHGEFRFHVTRRRDTRGMFARRGVS